jgi:ribosome biogenesis GTPase A
MASSFWKVVNEVLDKADIVVLVGDARAPKRSFNIEVIHKAERLKKKIIKVLNKVDFLTKDQQSKLKKEYPDIMAISATKHLSTMRLLRLINTVAKGEVAIVGVLGYPNTGKSSIINAIRGRGSAPVSSVSGYTKGKQIIRVTKKIKLIDTPGVIPYQEKDDLLHAVISAKSPEQMKDVEDVAMSLIELAQGKIEKFYKVDIIDDFDETLDNIALKTNLLKKGGKPDSIAAAKRILHDWQKHKIK